MKYFLKEFRRNTRFLSICILLLIGSNIFMNYNHKTDLPAAIIDKYNRLSLYKSTKKIIITGGSSSSYGVNSKKLQSTFNMPVVNTSLAMSLGSNFHLNMTKDYLNKGDVVLYFPEYEFYYGKTKGDDFLYTTAFYYPGMTKDFNFDQKKELLLKAISLSFDYYKGMFLKLIKNNSKPNSKINEVNQYSRLAYNTVGDNISLYKKTNSLIKYSSINRYEKLKSPLISRVFIEKLKEFNDFCLRKGVTFIIGFPPVEKSQFSTHFLEDINSIRKTTSLHFIGDPKEDVYNIELFYDTSYHLIGKGRDIRTRKLIERLQKEQIFN